MNKECCAYCKFLRRLKHNFKVGIGFEHTYCCVMWEFDKEANEHGYNDAWIQETDLDGMCECFCKGINCYTEAPRISKEEFEDDLNRTIGETESGI